MVKSVESLSEAIELAFEIHDEVIIESMLRGRELACGVYRNGDEIIALPVTEISSEREFFDYEAKYEDAATREVTPALIPQASYDLCQELSRKIYALTDCKGIARADFFLCDDGLFFVEINTVPGMSKESLVPKQFKASGIEVSDILTQIISSDLSI
jgi:D-alanine-D-alanine ligase